MQINDLNLKQRNKPKEPPKKPKLAPFFLPTVANVQGFTFAAALESRQNEKKVKLEQSWNFKL